MSLDNALLILGVIRYSTPHAAVKMRFVLMKIGLRNAASPL